MGDRRRTALTTATAGGLSNAAGFGASLLTGQPLLGLGIALLGGALGGVATYMIEGRTPRERRERARGVLIERAARVADALGELFEAVDGLLGTGDAGRHPAGAPVPALQKTAVPTILEAMIGDVRGYLQHYYPEKSPETFHAAMLARDPLEPRHADVFGRTHKKSSRVRYEIRDIPFPPAREGLEKSDAWPKLWRAIPDVAADSQCTSDKRFGRLMAEEESYKRRYGSAIVVQLASLESWKRDGIFRADEFPGVICLECSTRGRFADTEIQEVVASLVMPFATTLRFALGVHARHLVGAARGGATATPPADEAIPQEGENKPATRSLRPPRARASRAKVRRPK